MTYQLVENSKQIKRIADGASIPTDPQNRDYAEYVAWLSTGNTVLPVEVPTPAQVDAAASNAAKAELASIDLQSIRLIREYIAAKADAPAALKIQEAQAVMARTKVKP